MRLWNSCAGSRWTVLCALACALATGAHEAGAAAQSMDSDRSARGVGQLEINASAKSRESTEAPQSIGISGAVRQDAQVDASVDQVLEQPARYDGRIVRVRGRIEDAIGGRSFTLDESSVHATTDLLVLLPHAASGLTQGGEVIVTGRVQRFVRAQLQRDQASFDAPPHAIAAYEGHPVILADSVRSGGGAELLDLSRKARESGAVTAPVDAARQARMLVALTPASIARDPGSYFGHEVVVTGEVEDVFSNALFTLDEDPALAGPDVVVLNPRPALVLENGAEVAVTGLLQRFDWTSLRHRFPWLELDPQLVRALQSQPLVVATGVARMLPESPVRQNAKARPRRR